MAVTLNANTSTGFIATSDTSGVLQLQTGGTTAVTVDASQNVGIGTASPASDARLTLASPTTESYVMFSRTNSGVFDAAVGNNAGSLVFKGGADSATVAGLTEFMRIDSSGNVGIGTSSPASQLDVSKSGDAVLSLTSVGVQRYQLIARSGGRFDFQDQSAGATRWSVDQSGNLLVGTTSSYGGASRVCVTGPATANQQQISCHNPSTSGTRVFVTFGTEATYTERGWIQWNGSTMALTNASDSRLKENIVNAPSALTKIAAMQIRSFDFKEDGRHVDYGVVAQELNEVLPSAVFEGSDNEDGSINKPWSVGLEPIIPILVKAIQEQQAIITSLTDRITALEGTTP